MSFVPDARHIQEKKQKDHLEKLHEPKKTIEQYQTAVPWAMFSPIPKYLKDKTAFSSGRQFRVRQYCSTMVTWTHVLQ
jgi:hypothetical protein